MSTCTHMQGVSRPTHTERKFNLALSSALWSVLFPLIYLRHWKMINLRGWPDGPAVLLITLHLGVTGTPGGGNENLMQGWKHTNWWGDRYNEQTHRKTKTSFAPSRPSWVSYLFTGADGGGHRALCAASLHFDGLRAFEHGRRLEVTARQKDRVDFVRAGSCQTLNTSLLRCLE